MNIIEAVKSCKKFKRTSSYTWLHVDDFGHIKGEDNERIYLNYSDFVFDDWVIEEEKKELSWSKVEDAIRLGMGICGYSPIIIKEKLGFKE